MLHASRHDLMGSAVDSTSSWLFSQSPLFLTPVGTYTSSVHTNDALLCLLSTFSMASRGLRSGSALTSISPQQQLNMSRSRPPDPPQLVLHPTREMSDELSPIRSPTDLLLRARSGSLMSGSAPGVVARDKAPAPAKPPPLDTSVSLERKWTQEDQDDSDAQTRKKAMKDLVQSWMDRLQLTSLITTFFAATEAQLLSTTVPDDGSSLTSFEQAVNAGLAGALVIHVFRYCPSLPRSS